MSIIFCPSYSRPRCRFLNWFVLHDEVDKTKAVITDISWRSQIALASINGKQGFISYPPF
jgi:hypothetical protein